ncbi:MAG: 4Fe-4S binding protein, partial [Candidatus Hermodarchaeota archaeon]
MEIYSVLSHPLRRKILYLLEKEGFISYTDLMEKLSLDQTGQLNFHLKKLENLIGKDNKSYFLTDDGKQILKILNINKRILSGEDIDYLKTKGSKVNRIGVIVCNCNTEISNVLNINALESYLNKLNNVVSVKISNNLCQERNQNKIRSWITENFINKIVIAACSPRTHQHIFERLFQGIIDKTNIEIANIREQCCWVHDSPTDQLENLTILRKAQLIIEAAILRCTLQKEIKVKRVEVEKSCVILGGGIAGMNIALNLARAGFKVYLLEKAPTLGGKIARWHKISEMGDCSICFVSELIGELAREENIEILTNVEVTDISGEIANFTIELIKKARYVDEQKCTGCTQCVDVCAKQTLNEFDFGLTMRKTIFYPFQNCYPYVPVIYDKDVPSCLDCRICERVCANGAINLDKSDTSLKIKTGAIVLAIGSDLYEDLEEYHYDPKKNIIASAEFERIISSDGLTDGKIIKLSNGEPVLSVSIIQEIGPSNYLCDYMDAVALKYISVIEMKNPECEVNVFYDLSKIKDKNEIVLQYTHPRFLYANEVKVHSNGKENFVMADSIEFQSDLIILNTKLIPNKGLKELRKIIDFNLNENGFIIEGTLASGIFGVGTVYGPLDYKSTMSTVNNITIKIISLLSNDYLLAEYTGIEINEEKCGLCTLCIQICPYNAISIDTEKISID